MKNAILLHAMGASPKRFWYPTIQAFLEQRGYEVWAPQLPHTDSANLSEWLPFVFDTGAFSEETILVGHSAGVPLILSVLEKIPVQIHKAILVAGFARQVKKGTVPKSILQPSYDWKKIKANVKDVIFINSDNDPWGCNDEEGRYMWGHLGGTLFVRRGEGHMGSDSFQQPYTNFPFLKRLLTLP